MYCSRQRQIDLSWKDLFGSISFSTSIMSPERATRNSPCGRRFLYLSYCFETICALNLGGLMLKPEVFIPNMGAASSYGWHETEVKDT